jgi:DNA (cytosine-5)-methyltransferase 1
VTIRQLGIPGIAGVLPGELIVDLFAGGGGASHGIEAALGRSPDIAINHDPHAIQMHEANHPATRHHCQSVHHREVHPVELVAGRKVGLLWLSPDCRHFSRAKGGAPVSKTVRGLAWIGLRWAKFARPRVVVLENVPEFTTAGPLDPTNHPIKERAGEHFRAFVREWQRYGYTVEWRTLIAADYGAPTTRKRLFLVARCDGEPIVWPEPTHGKNGKPKPWRAAAEIIDWSLPCPSIFERKKPLAPATCRRIARGIVRYVLQGKPFVVRLGQWGGNGSYSNDPADPLTTVTTKNEHALVTPVTVSIGERHEGGTARVDEPMKTLLTTERHALVAPTLARMGHGDKQWNDIKEPLTTVTAQGNHHALVAPTLIQTGYGEREGQAPRSLDLHKPLGTAPAGGQKHGLVAAFLAKHNGKTTGQPVDEPAHVVTGKDTKRVIAAHLTVFRENSVGRALDEPVPTITSGAGAERPAGAAHALGTVAAHLSVFRENSSGKPLDEPVPTLTAGGGKGAASMALVAAFLVKYYSNGTQDQALEYPLATIVTRARMGLVTVTIDGTEYAVVDIGMRMLEPHELAAAQGFASDYVLTGTKSQKIARIGNSVCPPVAAAVVAANLGSGEPKRQRRAA